MDIGALAELAGLAAGAGGIVAATVVGTVAGLRRIKGRNSEPPPPPPPPQRPAVDPLSDTGQYPALDTGQMLSPVYQARLLRQIADQTSHLADRSNGHGAVRREELAALGLELRTDIGELRADIRQAVGLIGTHATAIARMQATCDARHREMVQ